MSRVFAARPQGCPPDSPPDYAIKVVEPPHDENPLLINLLRREALVGRQVSDAHVIPILAAGLQEAPYFVVMPRLEGATMASVLREAGRLPVARALWIGRQVAEGLGALHRGGWIHGDVNPSNIVVNRQGHATLIDLGFARLENESIGQKVRALMATLQYAAPEAFLSTRRENAQSDLYSLGVTLYEMLTGRVPFDGQAPAAFAAAHLHERPPNPRHFVPQLSQGVVRLLQKLLAKDPMRRPSSAQELVWSLVKLEMESLV
jgi:serine/threonine-protein kinase